MTVDLPTPPLPLATAMTRVCEPGPKGVSATPSPARSDAAIASRSSAVMASIVTTTSRPPAIVASACFGLGLDTVPQRAGGGGEHDAYGDVGVVDGDVAHHAEVDDAALQLGVLDGLERCEDVDLVHGILLRCMVARSARLSVRR